MCFQVCSLLLSPLEVAAGWLHRPGLILLNSFHPQEGPFCLLACEPEYIIEGHVKDLASLPITPFDALATRIPVNRIDRSNRGYPIHSAHSVNTASRDSPSLPAEVMMGWIAFDGSYRFGWYPNHLLYLYRSKQWLKVGAPPMAFEDTGEKIGSSLIPSGWMIPQVNFQAEISAQAFLNQIHQAKNYIRSGDIYQVCLAHRFSSPWLGHPWEFYLALCQASPAPYSAYLNLGNTTLLSTSPESFVEIQGRKIYTHPIKGTRPRRGQDDWDQRSIHDLMTSKKERAELVMITDLERNDLGQVCEFGSVQVTRLLHLQQFQQLYHLVSTVEGTLRPEVSHWEAIAACFPGGSISGAPKKRALEIIAELEPVPRGVYTGAIGYVGSNGQSAFSMAIRTVVIPHVHQKTQAFFHVGAGIVADSEPHQEWQETLDKAKGILLAASRMNARKGRDASFERGV